MSRYLAPGEEVIHVCRRHPVVMVKPVLSWLLGVAAVGVGAVWLTQSTGMQVIDSVAVWVFALLTAVLAFRYLQWHRERYLITSKRVLQLHGIVAVQVAGVSLARVTETSFSRSLTGRLLGYGELKLDSAGEQLGLATLDYLPHPEEVYRLVSAQLFADHHRAPAAQTIVDPSERDTGELPPVEP